MNFPNTHPSHVIGVVDDCYRCLNCEVLAGGSKAGTECPAVHDAWPVPQSSFDTVQAYGERGVIATEDIEEEPQGFAFDVPEPFTIERNIDDLIDIVDLEER